jgi:hypothetical protein
VWIKLLDITKIEQMASDSFKVLNGLPQYITLEQKEKAKITETDIKSLIEACEDYQLERMGVILDSSTNRFDYLSNLLLIHGFEHFSSKVEVYKELVNLPTYETTFQWQSLEDPNLSEKQFMRYWEHCMIGSHNKSSSLSMDQHLMSVKSELGASWRKSCRVFFQKEMPNGISIPHIEPGTEDEGRLFYFGILPEARGKGLSASLHLQSLWHLKEMGATHYIGSTHLENKKMQRVFEKNGCQITANTESYYKYFR